VKLLRPHVAAAALALSMPLGGCSTYEHAEPTEKPTYRFRLGPRDLVRVTVWGRPELLTETEVSPDGRISLPLAGVVVVNTLTLEEAAEKIGTQLKEFVRDPIVTIELREDRSSKIFVVGQVKVPGIVPFHNGITFLEAIQRSGSYEHEFANVASFLLIRDPLGAKQIYQVDMDALLTVADGQKDVFLQPDDIVYVRPRYVTQFAWWVRQVMAPIEGLSGIAYRGAYLMAIPSPF
jgi:polysaccharide export outer membrane protein